MATVEAPLYRVLFQPIDSFLLPFVVAYLILLLRSTPFVWSTIQRPQMNLLFAKKKHEEVKRYHRFCITTHKSRTSCCGKKNKTNRRFFRACNGCVLLFQQQPRDYVLCCCCCCCCCLFCFLRTTSQYYNKLLFLSSCLACCKMSKAVRIARWLEWRENLRRQLLHIDKFERRSKSGTLRMKGRMYLVIACESEDKKDGRLWWRR